MMLATSGKIVHSRLGRWHFLIVFLGGGIAGNFAMWLHYVIQKIQLQKDFLDPNSWPLLGDTAVGKSLDQGKRHVLSSSFDSLNSRISCIGCSASVSAIVSMEACITLETIITRLRQAVHQYLHRRDGDPIEVDLNLMYDLAHLAIACSIVWTDLEALFGKHASGTGILDNFFAYTLDRIGHGGHLGGFLFGILYYFFHKR